MKKYVYFIILIFISGKIFSQKNTIICIGDSMHNFSINNSFGSTYNWKIESSNSSASIFFGNGTSEISVKFNQTGIFELFVEETDVNGCNGNDSLLIEVISSAAIKIFALDNEICDGDSTLLYVNQNFSNLVWNNGITRDSIYAKNSGYYYVDIIDSNGCSSTSDSILILKYEQPSVNFVYEANCVGNITTFNDSTLSLDSIISYEWIIEDNLFEIKEVKYAFSEEKTYDVSLTVTTTNGCSNSIEKKVSVVNKPVAEFSFYTTNSQDFDSTVYFTNLSTVNIYNYWSFGDSTYSDEINPIHSYSSSGVYKTILSILDSNLCYDYFSKDILINLNLSFFVPSAFTPNNNDLNDDFGPIGQLVSKSKKYRFSIFNKWGAEVFSSDNPNVKWEGKNVQTGQYIWYVEIEDELGKLLKKYGVVNLIK